MVQNAIVALVLVACVAYIAHRFWKSARSKACACCPEGGRARAVRSGCGCGCDGRKPR